MLLNKKASAQTLANILNIPTISNFTIGRLADHNSHNANIGILFILQIIFVHCIRFLIGYNIEECCS